MKEQFVRRILVTGGAGFIGSNLVRHLVEQHANHLIVNLDALTYAGNLENLKEVERADNYRFVKGDICDAPLLERLFAEYRIDGVIHLAAESHVDRSIVDPLAFARTNVFGTLNLLNAARAGWGRNFEGKRFYHISTDEVYGSLSMVDAPFTEETRYSPRSPYSASKASSDHFVRAYHDTYGLPAVISNCSNNYGPYQFPEKLIPLIINNIKNRKKLPIYGQGINVRDWLYVQDHVRAIDLIFREGRDGETYNIGGSNERRNIDLVKSLIRLVDAALNRTVGSSDDLIEYVADRAGHDLRYAIDSSKLHAELGWHPQVGFDEGLRLTVDWYLSHEEWLNSVTTGEYARYYETMYARR